MRYFKVKTGFREEEFIPIDETELEAALYAFTTDSKAIFKNGAVIGRNIMGIAEDWHRAMGWNYGYKLTSEDFKEINTKGRNYQGLLAEAKTNVQHLIATGRIDLIGKRDYLTYKIPALHEGLTSIKDTIERLQPLSEQAIKTS